MENDKLDKICTDIAEIKVDLREHVRRTELLEDSVDELKKQSYQIKGAAAFIKLMGIFAAIAEAVHLWIH